MNNKTIAITGASGFIGSHLKEYFLNQGFNIKCLQRSKLTKQESRVTLIKYDLRLPLQTNDFLKVDTLIHCAFIPYSTKNKDADENNAKGTERLIKMCRKHNIKIIFLSSFSAHSGAQSHYGKNKLALENMLDEKRDLILKLGLVIGKGGVFQKIRTLLNENYIIPLIDNGKQLVQTIGIFDLLEIFDAAISKGIIGTYSIGEESSTSLKNIFIISRNKERKNLFLPISSMLVLEILKITERIGIFLPFSSENILGLKHAKFHNTVDDLKTFGVIIRPIEYIITNTKYERPD